VFDDEVIARIANTYRAWSQDGETKEKYADVPGFCRAVRHEEIKQHDYILTPGRYVGAEDAEEDDEAFAEKMQRLTAALSDQLAEATRLEVQIRKGLEELGYEV
jgi:type I restriction enzyme M protein